MTNPTKETIKSFKASIDSREFVKIFPQKGSYALYNVSEEYNRIIQDPDAWDWGIPLIESLVDFVGTLENPDDTSSVFHRPEWAEIVARRGPIEAVFLKVCPKCNSKNYSFGMSGFIDIDASIDYESKTVTFFSSYDKDLKLQIMNIHNCWKCASELASPTSEIGMYYFWSIFKKIRKDLRN